VVARFPLSSLFDASKFASSTKAEERGFRDQRVNRQCYAYSLETVGEFNATKKKLRDCGDKTSRGVFKVEQSWLSICLLVLGGWVRFYARIVV
jgi:hypothetical protein